MATARKQAGTAKKAAGDGGAGSYHHGDLRAALLAAAEQEIVDNGITGFSLRAAARRANVSHAAPAHHFGSAAALLAAVRDVGFQRLHAAIGQRMAGAGPAADARLAAAGKAYIGFARAHPQVFRLMFTRQAGPPGCTPEAPSPASQQAFGQLQACVAAVLGEGADAAETAAGVAAAWGLVHGLANLIADDVATFLAPFDAAQREAILDATLERAARTLGARTG